ncbi:hypothetical protein [Streptomyces sp. NPDC059063]|uniref:hypothetical protein n=1 Tax=unclassified Streptomyces TaxID=2593676 RepID=UPI0036827507
MDVTTWLAVLGFLTGVIGLVWQILTHRLTGGRVRVFAVRQEVDGEWLVRVDIVNAGRLAVSVEGVAIWAQVKGRRLRRIAWRAVLVARIGWAHARARLLVFTPSFSVTAPAGYADHRDRVQFPLILQPGQTTTLPHVGITWSDMDDRPLRAAVLLGAGAPVQTEVRDTKDLDPFVIAAPEGNWTIHFAAAWERPPTTDDESVIDRAMWQSALFQTLPPLLRDLGRLAPSPAVEALHDVVPEIQEWRGRPGFISDALLRSLSVSLEQLAPVRMESADAVRGVLARLLPDGQGDG